jgi:1-acyl-sn-glycerol-3-phosphate acyltransferase
MIYRLLRWFTGIALHWFYSSIEVRGKEKIPATGPILIAASHHNALVDALIAGWISPRKLTLTAKATLMDNAFMAWLFGAVGVVPLRRVSDEVAKNPSGQISTQRNAASFESILNVLAKQGAVLIFPEGKSHSEPALAPLKTGVSRMALAAVRNRGVASLQIIPLGLSFEDKGTPGTSVLAEIGEPITAQDIDTREVDDLTALVTERLAAVSLKAPAPAPDRDVVKHPGRIHPLASPLAAWGELTHRWVINYARDLAVARSRNPDDPAMLTIVFALVLILLSYAAQFVVVSFLLSPLWAAIYVATLPVGAYWAAYSGHRHQAI